MTETPGERVRQARKRAGLTQSQLAELVGTRTATISQIERGAAPVESWAPAIADALGVSTDWLFGRADESAGMAFEIASLPPERRAVLRQLIAWLTKE